MTYIDPSDIAKALSNGQSFVEGHKMNANHSAVKDCKLGTVFTVGRRNLIYVGVKPGNWKFPCIAYCPERRGYRKMKIEMFAKVAAASL